MLTALLRRLAEDDLEVHLVPLAEDGQGDSVARLVVAQGAEEVPIATNLVVAEARDYVALAHPGLASPATRHHLLDQCARVHGQVEPSGVLGTEVRRQHA